MHHIRRAVVGARVTRLYGCQRAVYMTVTKCWPVGLGKRALMIAPTAPEPPSAAPAAPEPPRAAPRAPEPLRAAPRAPEPPRAAPRAPEPLRAAPRAPEPPRAAPAAPEPLGAAPRAPEPPRAAPAAPEPPRAAPAAPEPPRAAPAAPEPPRAAPRAPEPLRAAPRAPEPLGAAPRAPEPLRAAPRAPEPLRAAPRAPEPLGAAPRAPEPLRAAPAAPEPLRAAPRAPEPLRAAPRAPEPLRAAPRAPEPLGAAPRAPEPPRAASLVVEASGSDQGVLGSDDRSSSGRLGKQLLEGVFTLNEAEEDAMGSQRFESSGGEGSPSLEGDVSVPSIVDGVGKNKVCFSPRGPSVQSRQRVATSPTVPNAAVAPPHAPQPTKEPLPPLPMSHAGTSPEGGSRTLGGFRSVVLNTIAPPSDGDVPRYAWAKSLALSLDEKIERACATKPLVRSQVLVEKEAGRLYLGIKPQVVDEATTKPVDKRGFQESPKGVSGMIDNHVIPGALCERAPSQLEEGMVSDIGWGERLQGGTMGEGTKECEAGFPSYGKEGEPQRKGLNKENSKGSGASQVLTERAPLAPWASTVLTAERSVASLKLSTNEVSPHVLTVSLRESLLSAMSAVRALDDVITSIERLPVAASGSVTHVVLTSHPGLNFFQPKQSSLELSCSERIELLRLKERLFSRMAGTAPLCFVAVVNSGPLEDFAAELFLACHYRVLLDPIRTTFGLPSSTLGDFPTSRTVRQLRRYFGLQRTFDAPRRRYRFDAKDLLSAGVACHAHGVQEALSILPSTYVDYRKASPPTRVSSLLENILFALVDRPSWRDFVVRGLCLFRTAEGEVGGKYINAVTLAWYRYCRVALMYRDPTLSSVTSSNVAPTLSGAGELDSEKVYSEFLYSVPALNAARVYRQRCGMQRRVISFQPSEVFLRFASDEVDIWQKKVKDLFSMCGRQATVLLECKPSTINPTLKLVEHIGSTLDSNNVVLIGDEYVTRPLLSYFRCVATISPASTYADSILGDLQEVRLFAIESCSEEVRSHTLCAALAYLQRNRRPYVVCRYSCVGRLIAALVTEACRIALQCDVERVERVATTMLGLLGGPFRLVDSLGTSTVSRLIDETDPMNDRHNPLGYDFLPAVGCRALRAMGDDGFGGAQARRGGFYTYDANGATLGVNTTVQQQYLQRPMTDTALADRLLCIVVNECCELLLGGYLLTAADANAITIAALGFSEATGGALTLADTMGAGLMLQRMEELSLWYGVHLRPSPLLKCMAHSRVSFASLSEAIVQSARM